MNAIAHVTAPPPSLNAGGVVTAPAPPAIKAAPFTTALVSLLRALARGPRGVLRLSARTVAGIAAAEQLLVNPTPEYLSSRLLSLITEDLNIRTSVCLVAEDGGPLSLAVAFALWKPVTEFLEASAWRHRVVDAERLRIREALASFPLLPSFLIDAGPEVWACWPLADPLPVHKDPAPAVKLLTSLAERLGADPDAAKSLRTLLPCAGPIRSWDTNPCDLVDIYEVAPEQTVPLTTLRAALGLEATS